MNRFDAVSDDVHTTVEVQEVERDGAPFLRGVVWRRTPAGWLHDGVEALDCPLTHGADVANVVLNRHRLGFRSFLGPERADLF